jgi:hypothetical protein
VQKGNACERRRERKAGDEEDEETEHFSSSTSSREIEQFSQELSSHCTVVVARQAHAIAPHAGMEEGGNQAVAQFGQQPLDFLQPFPQHVVRFPNLLSFFLFSLFSLFFVAIFLINFWWFKLSCWELFPVCSCLLIFLSLCSQIVR